MLFQLLILYNFVPGIIPDWIPSTEQCDPPKNEHLIHFHISISIFSLDILFLRRYEL